MLTEAVLRETSTFGVRLRSEHRRVLARKEEERPTSFGPVRVKRGYDNAGRLVKTHVEFEEVKRIADEREQPYRALLDLLKKEL